MAKNKIKAYSTNVLDYPSTMSMWEKKASRRRLNLAPKENQRKSLSQKKLISTTTSSVSKNRPHKPALKSSDTLPVNEEPKRQPSAPNQTSSAPSSRTRHAFSTFQTHAVPAVSQFARKFPSDGRRLRRRKKLLRQAGIRVARKIAAFVALWDLTAYNRGSEELARFSLDGFNCGELSIHVGPRARCT